ITSNTATQIGATVSPGTTTGPVKVTTAGGTATSSTPFTVTECPPIDLTPATLPDAEVGKPYSQTLRPTAGLSTSFTFKLTGSLPRVYPASQTAAAAFTISGTPTAGGIYTFTVTVTDQFGCTGSRTYTINKSLCPTIGLVSNPVNFPRTAKVGTPYGPV